MSSLLFVTYKKSKDISSGGDQCSKRNLDAICDVLGKENVSVVHIHDDSVKKTAMDYVKGVALFPFNYFFGLSAKKVRSIVSEAADKDYVFIDRSIFGIIAKKLKESGYKGKIVCFFHNVEKKYFADKVSWKNPARPFILSCADANDAYCCKYADTIVALNERDSEAIGEIYGRKADHLFPITFKDRYKKDSYPSEMTSDKPGCLFIGSDFPANVEGLQWFCDKVLPHVSVHLTVVGKGLERLKGKLPEEVDVIGSVPQTDSYFEQADIVVLPIFKGSGMKVKTCESLMFGKNIAGTPEAFEGYDIDCSKAGCKCSDAQDFIGYLKQIEAHKAPRFNSYSRNVFEQKYSSDSASTSIRHILSLPQ